MGWMMLKPINGVSIQHIRSASITPNRQEPITPDSREEADSPAVNTAQPNAAGISYNQHANFNVDAPGVILQNGSTVRIILHHVIGRTLSQLNSVIKIAGEPAQLVFSNANGIDCWGCHFLNTKHLVLTTGEPILNSDGELQAFRVKAGQITIKSNTTLKQFEQIDLIAYSIKVGGELSATKINMSTGTHEINYANTGLPTITRQQELSIASSEPNQSSRRASRLQFIETARVWAKEHLNIQADTLDNASLLIQSNGTLTVKAVSFTGAGTLSAGLDLAAELEEDYTHKNQLSAGRHLSISTTKGLINQGTLQTQGEITLAAKELENQAKSLIDGVYLTLKAEDWLRNYGVIQGSAVIIDTQHLVNDGTEDTDEHQAGVIMARRQLTIGAQTLCNRKHGLLHSDGDLSIGDTLDAQHKVKGSMQELANSSSSTIESRKKLSIQAGHLENKDGQIKVGSELILRSQAFINRQGYTEAQGDQSVLDVQANVINNNSGRLLNTSAGQTQIVARETILNRNMGAAKGRGFIFGKGPVSVTSAQIINDKEGVIFSNQTLELNASDYVYNKFATLSACQRIDIITPSLHNYAGGLISVGTAEAAKTATSTGAPSPDNLTYHAGVLTVYAKDVDNVLDKGDTQGGLIRLQGKIEMEAEKIFNGNKSQILAKNVSLNTKELLFDADSTLSASDTLDLMSCIFKINGAVQAKNIHLLSVSSKVCYTQATQPPDNDAQLNQSRLTLFQQARLYASSNLSVSTSGNLLNQGKLKIEGDISLKAKALENQASAVIDGQSLTLILRDQLKNDGVIQGSTVVIGAQSLINDGAEDTDEHQAGVIMARRHLTIGAQTLYNREHGLLHSDGDLSIGDTLDAQDKVKGSMQQLVNSSSSTIESREKLSIQAGHLDNKNGQIKAGSELILRSQAFINRQGHTEAKGDQSVLDVRAEAIDNTSGWLLNAGTGKTHILAHQTIVNSNTEAIEGAGIIFGKGPVTIQSPDLVNDAGGAIISDQILKIKTTTLAHRLSTLSASRRIEIDTDGLTSVGGLIAVGDDEKFKTETSHGVKDLSRDTSHVGVLEVRAKEVVSTSYKGEKVQNTLIRVQGKIAIKAQNIYNTNQTQMLGQHVNLSAEKLFANSDSTVLASEAFTLMTERFINAHGGNLQSQGDILLEVKELENQSGSLIDGAHLKIKAEKGWLKNDGVMQAGTTAIEAQNLTVQEGQLHVQGRLTIEAESLRNSNTGRILAKDLHLNAKVNFINEGGTVSASDTLSLAAQSLINSNKGLLQSNKDLHISVTDFGNLGTVRGEGLVLIKSERELNLKNERPGLIWGKTVSIGAHDRLNGFLVNQGSVIFAQNNLEIGIKEITNFDHGTLYSGGRLTIGGALDAQLRIQGLSERALNHGALIDASGDLIIHANKLVNQNSKFETQEKLIEVRDIQEYHDHHSSQRYDGSQIGWDGGSGGSYLVHHSDTRVYCFTNYNFTRHVTTTTVTHSEPGKIQAGGAIRLSGQVINDKSQIVAGGTLSDFEGAPIQIDNRDVTGQRVTTDNGTTQWSDREWRGGFKRYFQRHWHDKAPYHPAPVIEHHNLHVAIYQHHTAVEHPAPSSVLVSSSALVPSGSALTRGSAFLNSGLLRFNHDPNQPYLIQMDPRFTRNSDRVSSDLLLQLLNLDPQHVPKRLGDGFYEQQLIRDQIIGLSGHYYLSSHRNSIAEFKALMHAGASLAKRFELRLGIEPTAEQVDTLSTSPVWLVNRSVQLPDGSEQTVLVPKVYLAKSDAPAVPLGNALISADTIELHSDRRFKNTGTVLSRGKTNLRVSYMDNQRGTLASLDTLSIQARDDIDSRAGKLIAVKKLTLQTGQNLQLQSQAETIHAASGKRTNLVGITQIKARELEATAASDINLAATQIDVEHAARLEAKQDLILGTATTGEQLKIVWDERNALSLSKQTEIGTQVQAGALELKAGRDVTATGAYVKTAEKLALKAGRDIHLEAAYEETDFEESHYHESSTFLTSSSEFTHNKLHRKQALSSTLSGGTVQIEAGHDLNIMGSNVVGMHDVDLYAANDIQQKAVEQAERGQHYSVKERSGLLDSGKFGVMVGTRTQKDTQENEHTPQIGSVIGSVSGHVRAIAGREYEQSGSQWVVPTGDIEIRAGKGKIDAAYEESRVWQRSEWQQSGLTVSVSAPVLAAVQTNQQMLQASTQVSDPVMQTLAASASVLATKNAYDAIQADPKAAGGAAVNVMIGEDHCETEQTRQSKTALNSTLAAGGKVSIQISGLEEESTLDLIGARIEAKQDITLNVEGRVNVEAAPNSLIEQSQQQSRSFAVGMAATLGSQNSVGASLAVSVGHGHADGAQISYTPTLIQAGGKLTLNAQSDVRLKGAQIAGEQVKAQIEGNLEIDSVQNTATYRSHSQSISGSVTVGPVSAASLHFSQRRMDSRYLSVAEQAGIQAGEGGFQITVKGDTKLVGGVIAGAEQAVREGKNTLLTGTLQQTDLTNQASYDASSISLGGGYSKSGKGVGSKQSGEVTTPAHSGNQLASRGGMSAAIPIVMNASGQAQSTTRSAISGAEIVIMDEARQMELTGQSAAETIASLNRNPAHSHQALAPIFNRAEIEASFDIVNALGREAGTFIGNRGREADHKLERAKNIETQANDESMPVAQRQELLAAAAELRTQAQTLNKQWGAGGSYRRIVTALTAAAAGNVTGTTAQFTQAAALNYLQSLGAEKIKHIADSLNDETARAALHGALAYGGAVARGQSGGAAALGASASVLVNTLLGPVEGVSEEEKEARRNIVTSLVAGFADVGGVDATSAQNAAQIEIENNAMVLAAPLLVTPPGLALLGLLGAVATGAVVTKGAMDYYEEYKERANNTEQPGEDDNQLVQQASAPKVKLIMEPPQSPLLPGTARHPDEEVLLGGRPNQSGEHVLQPMETPREVQSAAGNVLENPIADPLTILDTVKFSKGTKKANRDENYVPNAGSVDNMDQFFNDTEFGREMRHIANPTKEFYKGARLYKATDKIKNVIKEGDFFYLDTAHKNHLEVLNNIKKFSHVLNFDGTINEEKTVKAEGRKLGK